KAAYEFWSGTGVQTCALPISDWAKHVAAHEIGAARAQQTALGGGVRLVRALVAKMPAVKLAAPPAERVFAALIWPGDEAVEGDQIGRASCRERGGMSGEAERW